MKHFIHITLLMTVVGCTSTADNNTAKQSNTTQTAAIAANSKEKPKDGLVCKMEKKLGSNHRTKICRPKDNEHDTAIRNRQMMEDLGAK